MALRRRQRKFLLSTAWLFKELYVIKYNDIHDDCRPYQPTAFANYEIAMKRFSALVDVILVLALFLGLRLFLKNVGFGDWQEPIFGRALVSSSLLFFVLPLIFVIIRGRDVKFSGLAISYLRYHSRVTIRAAAIVAPVTILFPVIDMLGTNPMEWLGASILTVGFLGAGFLFAANSTSFTKPPSEDLSSTGLLVHIALLVAGLIIIFQLHPLSQLAARIVGVLIFVGFLEEFFFRGYVQSRLNDCFGKPFRFQQVEFGAGMFLAAAMFGLFHPITVANGTPWAWGLWTAAFGLVMGYLREKTGTFVAPAILHGVMWIPGVLFGPSAG